jgi:hypothetical protein
MAQKKKVSDLDDLDLDRDTRGLGGESGGQSGDLQGLSERESVDSESVEELVEEGQAWEASAISGVEEAEDEDGNPREVHTHEVLENDVPEEYDEDQER